MDPARAALLVHDLQNHFFSAYQTERPPCPNSSPTSRCCGTRRPGSECPVVYTAQPGGQTPEERGLQQDFWGPGHPADPHAEAIAAQVAPGEGDTALTKWKYSAFVRWRAALGRGALLRRHHHPCRLRRLALRGAGREGK